MSLTGQEAGITTSLCVNWDYEHHGARGLRIFDTGKGKRVGPWHMKENTDKALSLSLILTCVTRTPLLVFTKKTLYGHSYNPDIIF
jgi:hypothetical protein